MVDEETGNPCVIIVAFPDAIFINTKITFRYVQCLTMLKTNVTLRNRIDKIGSDAKLWRREGGWSLGDQTGLLQLREIFFRSVPCRVAIERRKGISF